MTNGGLLPTQMLNTGVLVVFPSVSVATKLNACAPSSNSIFEKEKLESDVDCNNVSPSYRLTFVIPPVVYNFLPAWSKAEPVTEGNSPEVNC